MRDVRKKQAEAASAARAGDDSEAAEVNIVRPNEPSVATTPFQATRLMRAFDVFPNPDALMQFKVKVNVDLTRESVRGICNLPHGLQTKVKVLAFCSDEEADDMLKAGADVAGITEPLRRIGQGWLGFDRCLATPGIMPQVMKVARVLGPKKMMPNPKSGTVVDNLREAIREAKGGTLLEYRAEGAGEIKVTLGDASFPDAKVLDNMKFFVQTLLRARPRNTATSSAATPASPGAGGKKAAVSSDDGKDVYFLESTLKLDPAGAVIAIDPETILPASVGYFR